MTSLTDNAIEMLRELPDDIRERVAQAILSYANADNEER